MKNDTAVWGFNAFNIVSVMNDDVWKLQQKIPLYRVKSVPNFLSRLSKSSTEGQTAVTPMVRGTKKLVDMCNSLRPTKKSLGAKT